MKTSEKTEPSSMQILTSYIIYKASGERIITKTARLKIDEARQKHKERIQAMQEALDKEHLELRGWTNETRDTCPKKPTAEMEAKLRQEIERGRRMLMNVNA